MMAKFFISLSMFLTLHLRIEAIELPHYWICEGNSQQKVIFNDIEVARYFGDDPVLLEIAGQYVNQFMAPALFGMYVQCMSQANIIVFQKRNCLGSFNDSSFGRGELNLQTGQLSFLEFRTLKGKKIKTQANYQCEYIGHTYNFNRFNHAKNPR